MQFEKHMVATTGSLYAGPLWREDRFAPGSTAAPAARSEAFYVQGASQCGAAISRGSADSDIVERALQGDGDCWSGVSQRIRVVAQSLGVAQV